jgi:hypothetical protein
MPVDGCPNPTGHWFLDPRTGERWQTPCRRLRCVRCGPVAALQTAAAIVIAQPEWSAVLSTWGPDVPTEPGQLFRVFVRAAQIVAHELRADGKRWEFAWTGEIGEGGTAHVHLLSWGDPVSRKGFRQAASRAGMQWADIQPIRSVPVISKYVVKGALRPLDDPIEGEPHLLLHLELTGHRIVRASRRFWRNGAEEPLSGLREARAVARKARPPGRRPTPAELAKGHAGWQTPPMAKEDELDGAS